MTELVARPPRRRGDAGRWRRAEVHAAGASWNVDVVEAPGERDEDRVACVSAGARVTLAVVDGAGGTGRGAAAANALVAAIERDPRRAAVPLLADADVALAPTGGECAAAVVDVSLSASHFDLSGASVGDARVWVRTAAGWTEPTARQRRKPLIGSGRAVPIAFSLARVDALVLASDGLASYAALEAITALVDRGDSELGWALLDLVRLPSGGLHDDVSVIVLRRAQ